MNRTWPRSARAVQAPRRLFGTQCSRSDRAGQGAAVVVLVAGGVVVFGGGTLVAGGVVVFGGRTIVVVVVLVDVNVVVSGSGAVVIPAESPDMSWQVVQVTRRAAWPSGSGTWQSEQVLRSACW